LKGTIPGMKLLFYILCLAFSARAAYSQSNDSLLAHVPLHTGNLWDYEGWSLFLGHISYPRWILLSVVKDSIHANGKKYAVLERKVYDMQGEQDPGTLGITWKETFLQRVDSSSLNVYQLHPWQQPLAGEEFLIDSLRAQVGDSIITNLGAYDNILLFSEHSAIEAFGRRRSVRHLLTFIFLVSFQRLTAEGLGEFQWSSGGEGEPSFYELKAAIIQEDTLGSLLRGRPPGLMFSPKQLRFSQNVRNHAISFINPNAGLTIVDSVKIGNSSLFYSQPSYKGGRYSHTFFCKGPFLVFPKDSIRLDLFLREGVLHKILRDTLRVFAHGLNGDKLPEITMPVAVDLDVSVDDNADRLNSETAESYLTAYPNPARSNITISFKTKETRHVKVRIIDLAGREIARWDNHKTNTGRYQFVWPTATIPTGIYFVILETPQMLLSKKVLVLKQNH